MYTGNDTQKGMSHVTIKVSLFHEMKAVKDSTDVAAALDEHEWLS